MGRSLWGVVVVAALAAMAMAPVRASASVGEITEALATPDWSHAALAGTVAWNGCELERPKEPEPPRPPEGEEEPAPVDSPPPRCDWMPFVTVGPGDCSAPGRQPETLGSGIVLAWEGAKSGAAATLAFNVSAVPLGGGTEQIACLGLIEEATAFPWHAKVLRDLASKMLMRMPPVPPCACPSPGHRKPRRHHPNHRHHRIWVSQRQEVPKS